MVDPDQEIRWIEIKITTDGELAEALAEVLGRFVINGVVVETVTEFNPATQENEPTGEITVAGYLPVDENLEAKQRKLEEALWHLGQISPLPAAQFTPIKAKDWMEAWKAHYHPVKIGQSLLIMPAWKNPDADQTRLVVRINPAMAFGTGTHPTTQLCLQLLERHLTASQPVIDVGCGSGILSIAAWRMGAEPILAVDVDGQAVTSTLENAALNDIPSGILETGKGSVEEILTGRFTLLEAPLVLVNILAPIIIRLFENGLDNLVSKDGKLLLSGILNEQEPDVLQAAEDRGFVLIERLADKDWVSLALKNASN